MRRALPSMLWLSGVLAFAGRAHADAPDHQLAAGAVAFTYLPAVGTTPTCFGGEVSYHFALGLREGAKPFRIGGGVRTAAPLPTVPLEGFLQTQLQGHLGAWRPAAGPEVGVSGFARFPVVTTGRPEGGFASRRDDALGVGYLAFAASPLRFEFGRWTLVALESHIGASFPPLGGAARVQLGLVQMGFAL